MCSKVASQSSVLKMTPRSSRADGEARVGDRHVATPEQGFGPLDPAGHEVAVRALAERSLEAAGEVASRHRGRSRKSRHIERPVEMGLHPVDQRRERRFGHSAAPRSAART